MPLTGELEHLPIIDVIQLIHSTRKSGNLNVYSRKGEGRLIFDNGYIVGASHSDDKLRIGQILLEANIISEADLKKALQLQQQTGEEKKPLITTLFDHCDMSKDMAYKALETLIEMTVVEMISWTKGIFSLDAEVPNFNDNYRYLPTQLEQITLDTQMVLMDALRIFDEKVHAGEIELVDEPLDEMPQLNIAEASEEPSGESDDIVLSEDILGLADLDQIEKKKPRVFEGLEAFDPAEIHRQVIEKTLPELEIAEKEQLTTFLSEVSTPLFGDDSSLASAPKSQAVIMYTHDEFIQHAIMTVCKKEGILVFMSSDKQELDSLIDRTIGKCLEPILVFGGPVDHLEGFTTEEIIDIRAQKLVRYPNISIIQLASPLNYSFSLQSLKEGVRAVLPKPYLSERRETYVEDIINFFNTFQAYIRSCFNEERRQQFATLRNSLSGLRLLDKAPNIALTVLQFVGEFFERSLTLIVDKSDLIAERSLGIVTDKNQGVSAAMKFRIPVVDGSIFQDVIKEGTTHYGPSKDGALEEFLYPEIGAPMESTMFLLPLKSNERIITLTYADFGNKKIGQVPLDFLEFFISQAGIAMENALFRKQMKKSSGP
ncbi:MAG: DUF4388 domain-containing protein [Desulfuromonadales bacterium]|nr:DUF4388 domain-containing protein [Desulfuromonadales bacterium]